MQYVNAIVTRYASTAVQFVIALLAARLLSPSALGTYLSLFGVMTATQAAAGFGAPDGFVRWYPEEVARAGRESATESLGGYLGFSCLTTVLAAILIGSITAVMTSRPVEGLVVAIWWLGYGAAWVGAQALVGVGRSAAGTFMYYGSSNWASLAALLIYLLVSRTASLLGLLTAVAVGSLVAGLAAFVMLFRSERSVRLHIRVPKAMVSTGTMIALGRVVQSVVIWSPVWVSGFLFGSSTAATVGLASRLVMSVGAAVAAIRFSVRPRLVELAVRNDWKGIEVVGRRIALACGALCVATVVGNVFLGTYILPRVFGSRYEDLAPVITILLLGVTVESLAGPTDEVLKMSDGARFVLLAQLASMVVSVIVEVVVGLAAGEYPMLIVFSVSFAGLYVAIAYEVFRRRGVIPAVFPRGTRARAAAAAAVDSPR